ncbi:protein of unknown function [Azospirillum baldaniorum]|uniref:Uncharacterized protein n=1 Tax=Azospirillum baldaniorum TaxID=1064539 RepID=A0A9P1JNA2_9PROT|nr:protein of unknown function [Azospirillum baldaniorum]
MMGSTTARLQSPWGPARRMDHQ